MHAMLHPCAQHVSRQDACQESVSHSRGCSSLAAPFQASRESSGRAAAHPGSTSLAPTLHLQRLQVHATLLNEFEAFALGLARGRSLGLLSRCRHMVGTCKNTQAGWQSSPLVAITQLSSCHCSDTHLPTEQHVRLLHTKQGAAQTAAWLGMVTAGGGDGGGGTADRHRRLCSACRRLGAPRLQPAALSIDAGPVATLRRDRSRPRNPATRQAPSLCCSSPPTSDAAGRMQASEDAQLSPGAAQLMTAGAWRFARQPSKLFRWSGFTVSDGCQRQDRTTHRQRCCGTSKQRALGKCGQE